MVDPVSPASLYPNQYGLNKVNQFRLENPPAPLAAPTPGGTLPAAALQATLPAPRGYNNYPLGKDKTVADLLGSVLPALAGTAGVSGLLVAGVDRAGHAENRKRHAFDSIGFANTSLGIAIGLAGGGIGKVLESKFGKGFGASLSYSPGGSPSVAPVPGFAPPPPLLPPGPTFFAAGVIPLWPNFTIGVTK